MDLFLFLFSVFAAIVGHQVWTSAKADHGEGDLPSRILAARSDIAGREFSEVDYGVRTTKYFTPSDLLVALEFVEDQLDTPIPRSVYWQDTIGDVVESVSRFAETTLKSKYNSTPEA